MAPPRAGSALSFAVLAASSLVLRSRAADAQPGRGAFEDASLPQRGEVRLRVPVRFDGTHDQFGRGDASGDNGRVPLGSRLSADSLGASRIPALVPTVSLLRDSVGVGGLALSLGTVETRVRTLYLTLPLQFELGVTRRLSLGAIVPLVRSRAAVDVVTNRGGATGNLGFNPANATASGSASAAATTRNALVQAQLGGAVDTLAARLARCPATATSGTPGDCLPIIADRGAAQQLVTRTRTVARGVSQLYGGTTASGGTLFVPVVGSDAQLAVQQRLQTLAGQFVAFGVAGTTFAAPAGATSRLATPGLQRVLTEEAFGILADTVRTLERAAIGDVEFGASFMWFDSFVDDGAVRARGTRVRSTVGASYRAATGSISFPATVFDIPSGTGSAAMLLRSATDVSMGRRVWASLVARAEVPLARDVLVRVPLVAGEAFSSLDREAVVARTLGRQLSLEATPRWTPNDAFGASAHYAVRIKQRDRYEIPSAADAPVASADLLSAGSGSTAHVAGFGLSYSTLPAYTAGRSALPMDVSYVHTSTFAASGGITPATRRDEFAVRLYFHLLGGGTRRSVRPSSASPR